MKKIILAAALLAMSFETFAGNIYFGPTFFLQTNTSANIDNFRGFHPRISFGYGDFIDCFYLAGELFVVPTTVSISESESDRQQSVRTTTSYGFSFIPGLLLSESIIAYARVGLTASNFYGPDEVKSGAQLGFGLESSLSEVWSIRVEYLYTSYPSISTIGSPTTDQYGIGLIYKLK